MAAGALRLAVIGASLLLPLAAAPMAQVAPVPMDEPRPLELGAILVDSSSATDSLVHTPTLDAAYTDGAIRGKRYRLAAPAGTLTIELRSHFFDGYLVVRDATGALLAEADDGWIRCHPRIVLDLATAAQGQPIELEVTAVALDGGAGRFELTARAGTPPELDDSALAAAELADLRAEFAVREAALGPDHARTLATIETLAEALAASAPDESRELRERLERSRSAPQTLTAMHEVALLARAGWLRNEGRHADAIPYWREIVARDARTYGVDHPQWARSLTRLANACGESGALDAAIELCREALDVFERTLGPEHPDTAACLNNLAGLLDSQGKYDEARPLYERALAIREKVLGAEHSDTAESLNNLAFLLIAQGKYEEARPPVERALAIFEKVLGPEHPETATSLNNLAVLLESQGKYEEARPLLERALDTSEKVLGPEHPNTSLGLNNLAFLLQSQGKYAEAHQLHERALAIKEKVLGPEHPDTALGLDNLAVLLDLQGKSEEARPLFERSLAIRERVRGPEHPDTATSLDNLALNALYLGEVDHAFELAQTSLSRRRRHAFEQSPRSSMIDLFAAEANREGTLGIALAAARLSGEAALRPGLLPEVIDWKSAATREARRRGVAQRATHDPELERMLDRLCSARAALSNLFSIHEILDREEHERNVERLRKERVALEVEVNAKLAARPDLQPVGLAQIGAAVPEGSVLVEFLSMREFRPAQREGGAVVRPAGRRPNRMLAWVVRAGAPDAAVVDLGPSADLGEAIEALLQSAVPERAVVAAVRGASPADREKVAARPASAAARLSKLLWKPLAPLVGDATTLLLSPDGALALLPFGMVPDGDGKLLIEKYRIVQLDDVEQFVRRRTGASAPVSAAPASLLLAGGIDYSLADDEGRNSPFASAATGNLAAPARVRGSFTRDWPALDGTAAEAVGIAALRDSSLTQLTAAAATEERLKQELPRHAFIHLATHGYFLAEGHRSLVDAIAERSTTDLLQSHQQSLAGAYFPSTLCGLVCAGANQLATSPPAGRDNGLLTGEEIAGLDLSGCDLAVLSACETGLGTNAFGAASGQGAMSLARAFRDAGAKTVISSLWRVQDDSTRELMLDFYDRLWNRGESKLDALRGAQLAMLKRNRDDPRNGGDTLPATWGAFVLTGEWE